MYVVFFEEAHLLFARSKCNWLRAFSSLPSLLPPREGSPVSDKEFSTEMLVFVILRWVLEYESCSETNTSYFVILVQKVRG